MSTIALGKLSYTTGLDMGGWRRDIGSARSDFAALGKYAAKALDIKPPAFSMKLPALGGRAGGGGIPALPKVAAAGPAGAMSNLASSALGAAAGFGKLAIASAAVVGVYKTAEAGVGFLAAGVKGASDLNEALNKTNVLMGDAAPAVKGLADDFAKGFGKSKTETLGAATAVGALLKNAGGLKGDALGGATVGLTKLMADLASIDNSSLKDVGQAFTIALSGEQSDLLKRFGIDTREAAVEQYALSRGIARVGDDLTQSQKVMARAGILQEGLAFASGDLANTINEPANAYRKFTGTLENFGASIGSVVLPPLSALLSGGTQALTAVSDLFERNKATMMDWSNWIAGGITSAIGYMSNWRDSLELGQLAAGVFVRQAVEEFGAFKTNIGIVINHIGDNWLTMLKDVGSAWLTVVTNGIENSKRLVAAVSKILTDPTAGFDFQMKMPLEGFKASTPKMQAFEAAKQAVVPDADAKRMAELMAKINGPAIKAPGPVVGAAPAPLLDMATIDAMKKSRAELEQFAKSFKDRIRTPMEEYGASMVMARKAFDAKLITADQFARADQFAKKEAGIKDETKFAGAADLNSTGAYTVLTQGLYGSKSRPNDVGNGIARDNLRVNRQVLQQIQQLNRKLGANNEPVVMERAIV